MFNLKNLFKKSLTPTEWAWFYPLTNTNYWVRTLGKSDYLRLYTGWQYVAVSTIANSVAELEYSLTRTINDDKEIQHPYRELVTYELLMQITSFLQLSGNCYLWKYKLNGKVQSLEVMRPDMVEIQEKGDGSLDYYRYNYKGGYIKLYDEDIIVFSLFNPMMSYPYTVRGVSPMQAVAIQAEMDMTANKWNWNFFKQGATVGGTLETDQNIDQVSKKRLIEKWKQEFQWVNNSHKIAVLDNGLKYNEWKVNQKELDFVESRRFTRDEVFAIFKVPKSIVWVSDDVNRASALVAENTFYRVCIRPLAKQMAETFNKELFDGIGVFQFVNVVPADTEQLLLDLNNWAITINEYRIERGFPQIKDADVLKLNPMFLSEQVRYEGKKELQSDTREIVRKAIAKNTKGTQEWKEKLWHQKIQRTNRYETRWIKEINEVFQMQMEDVMKQINKDTKAKKPTWNAAKYAALWQTTLWPLYNEVMMNEGTEANLTIGINSVFEVWDPWINKYIRDNIKKLAKEIDDTTKNKIFDVIEQGNNEGLGAQEIAWNISEKFDSFKKSRALMIARTEITRASNEATERAYIESWVVLAKEYLAELDDRTSDICQSLNGRIFQLWEPIMEKGTTIAWYTNDYETAYHPPTHPNCRCTLIPVIK